MINPTSIHLFYTVLFFSSLNTIVITVIFFNMLSMYSTLQKVSMSGAEYLHVLEKDIPLSSIPKVRLRYQINLILSGIGQMRSAIKLCGGE